MVVDKSYMAMNKGLELHSMPSYRSFVNSGTFVLVLSK